MHTKGMCLVVASFVALGLLSGGPAQGGTTWREPQEVSSKFGRDIQLSESGQVAAWIRTNRTAQEPTGPVRTAFYRSAKKGWTDSAQMPGTAETRSIQLSADGQRLMVVNEEGVRLATRTDTNTWSAPTTVVADKNVIYARMSADARVVVMVTREVTDGSWSPPVYIPPSTTYTLLAATRDTNGAWSAPVTIAPVWTNAYFVGAHPGLALSASGRMVVWLGNDKTLQSSALGEDGTWSPPQSIKSYTGFGELFGIRLSNDGSRLVWFRDRAVGAFTTTWSGGSWSPVDNVTVDDVTDIALSPDGTVAAWANEKGKVKVADISNGQFSGGKAVGKGGALLPDVLLSNSALAWAQQDGGALRASVRKGGSWKAATLVGKKAINPALSADGRTLVWASVGDKHISSVKR